MNKAVRESGRISRRAFLINLSDAAEGAAVGSEACERGPCGKLSRSCQPAEAAHALRRWHVAKRYSFFTSGKLAVQVLKQRPGGVDHEHGLIFVQQSVIGVSQTTVVAGRIEAVHDITQ